MGPDKFGSQLDIKNKNKLFLMQMFSESNRRTKFWSHSFYLQNSGILQTKMDQSGPKWPKWITQTVRAQKVDEKMGSFV